MANEPFIKAEDRPEMTLNLDGKVGDLTVRELATILGFEPIQDLVKEGKVETKERKDSKDSKDNKESKDRKEQKEQKDPKDSKDQKDQKDFKDQKDQKDTKDAKDHKEHKDHKDTIFESKDRLKEVTEGKRFTPEKSHEIGPGPVVDPNELDQLVKRISGLEQSVEELKKLIMK
jgi:hypothetical protein